MSFNLAAIHNALAAQLEENIARSVHVYAFDPGETRQYPCITIDPGDPYVVYHETFGPNGLEGITLRVSVHINAAEIDQRIALADFCSDGAGMNSSVRQAVEVDQTWGGTVATSVCIQVGAPEQADELGVLTATFDVQAHQHRGGS